MILFFLRKPTLVGCMLMKQWIYQKYCHYLTVMTHHSNPWNLYALEWLTLLICGNSSEVECNFYFYFQFMILLFSHPQWVYWPLILFQALCQTLGMKLWTRRLCLSATDGPLYVFDNGGVDGVWIRNWVSGEWGCREVKRQLQGSFNAGTGVGGSNAQASLRVYKRKKIPQPR